MEHYKDLPKITESKFLDRISISVKSHRPIYIVCNDISKLIGLVLKQSEKLKIYDTYYQPNTDFYGKMETSGIMTYESYKKQFEDYCNYFDKYRMNLISRINKKLYNYSKNRELLIYTDYPEDIKMFLIVENFNFWDLNSQSIIGQITEENNNIIVIGQLRSDFDFAVNHIDVGLRTGKGGGSFMALE